METSFNQPQEKSGGVGPVIGSIIVIVLILLAGLYFWGEKVNKEEKANVENTGQTEEVSLEPTVPADIQALQTQGTGDDVESIRNDLNATVFSSFEEDLKAIDADVSAGTQ